MHFETGSCRFDAVNEGKTDLYVNIENRHSKKDTYLVFDAAHQHCHCASS